MKAARGESGAVTLPTGERLTIDPVPISQVKGGALVHATPMGSVFDKDLVVQGSEGGMFFAPSGSPRFASQSAIGKQGEFPTYGVLVDPDMIAGTQSSGKWWNRQAEIERVVPDEVVIPKAEQYLQAHSVPDLGGQPYSVAMLGGRLSPVEIAKLKAQGILKAAQDLTPGGIRSKGWRIEDGPSGRPVDPDGRPLSPDGRPLDPDGRPTDPSGRPVDADGRPLGPDGRRLDDSVDPDGRPLGPDGRPDGRRRGFDDGEVHGSGRELRFYSHLGDRT